MSEPDERSSKGGTERARALSPTRRREIARRAALARWIGDGSSSLAIAKWGTADKPLRIGSIEIPCYVLADGRRVLAQRGLLSGIGMSVGGGRGGERKLVAFLSHLMEKGMDTAGLVARVNSPIHFIPPHGGNPADGYEATILPDLCAAIITAGQMGFLHKRLVHLAERAAILQHGFATVGIVALVDEATGYQADRARDALARILEKFIAKELRPWVRTFPAEFYEQMFRLRGWDWKGMAVNRPQVAAYYTKDLIYARLAPGVLDELKRVTPRNNAGRPKAKLFQSLTENLGHPKLKEHLAAVVALMRICPDRGWEEFMDHIDRALPKFGETLKLLPPDPKPRLLPA